MTTGNLPALQGEGPSIPQSDALAEAQVDSISELCSRDPENLSQVDLARLVEALRAQRVKWAAGEAERLTKPKTPKATSDKAKSLLAKSSAGDLGL